MPIPASPPLEKLQRAIRLEGSGKLELARDAYRKLVDDYPDHLESLSLLGKLEQKQGDHKAAIFHLRRAARMAPERPDIHLGLGRALVQAGDSRTAVKSFMHAIQVNQEFAPAYVSLGIVFAEHGDDDQAIRAFDHARRLNPESAEAYYQLGLFHQQRDHLEPAIAAFLNCLKSASDYQDAGLRLAQLFVRQSAFSEALEQLQRYLGKYPEDSNAWALQAEAFLELGMISDAMQSCQLALQFNPANATAMTRLGRAHFINRDLKGAERSFIAAISLDPENPQAYVGCAEVAEQRGETAEALRFVRSSGDPRQFDLNTALLCARLLQNKNQCEEAVRLLRFRLKHRLDSTSGRRRCHYLLGELYGQLQNFSTSMSHFRNANHLDPRRFEIAALDLALHDMMQFFDSKQLMRTRRAIGLLPAPILVVGLPGDPVQLVTELLRHQPGRQPQPDTKVSFEQLAQSIPQYLASPEPYPNVLGQAREAEINELAQRYLRFNHVSADASHFVSRNLTDILYTGLVQILFPDVKVVHVVRDTHCAVMDVYTRYWHGTENAFSNNAANILAMSTLQDRALHYWEEQGLVPVLQIRYTDLLIDPESAIRRLFAFAGKDISRAKLKVILAEVVGDQCVSLHDQERRYHAYDSPVVMESAKA